MFIFFHCRVHACQANAAIPSLRIFPGPYQIFLIPYLSISVIVNVCNCARYKQVVHKVYLIVAELNRA